jgi:hypothetical protein
MEKRDMKFIHDAVDSTQTKRRYVLFSKIGETTELEELPKSLGSDPNYVAYSVDIETESNGKPIKRKELYVAFNGDMVNPGDFKSTKNKMFKKVGEKCFASYIKYLSTRISTDYDRAVRHFGKNQ